MLLGYKPVWYRIAEALILPVAFALIVMLAGMFA